MINKKGKVIQGIFSDFFLTGIKSIKQILFVPIILFFIGSENFGEYLTIISYAGFYGLLDLNFGLYFTKSISKRINKNNDEFLSMCFFLIIINVIILFFTGILLHFIFLKFNIIPFYNKYSSLFIILLTTKTLNVILGFYNSILISRHEMFRINLYRIISMIFDVIISIIFLKFGLGLSSLIYSELIASFLLLFLSLKYFKLFFKLKILKFNYLIFIKAFKFSLSNYLIKISKLGLTNLDSIIINFYLGPKYVTLYNISLKLPILVSREIGGKISTNLFSSVSSFDLKENIDYIKFLFSDLIYIIFRFSFISSITIFFINESFVEFWIGSDLYYGNKLTLIFSLMLIIELIYFFCETLILSQINIKKLGILSFLEFLCNLILSVIFVKIFDLYGVAIASLLSKILISFIYVIIKAKKSFYIKYPNIQFYLKISFSFIITYLFFYFFNSLGVYEAIIFGIIIPFISNLIIEDYSILKEKKLSIKEKVYLIVFKRNK